MTNQNSEPDDLSADELREQLIALQEENKVLTDLFHAVVFDLRTPLSMIAGAANLLLDEKQDLFPPLNEKQAEVAEIALFHATRVNEVIRELLERAKKAKTMDYFGSSLAQDYQSQLLETSHQLGNFWRRKDALHNLFLNFVHDFYTPLTIILAYTKLYQEKLFLPSDSLEKLIEIFDSNAKKSLTSFQLFRSAYATIYASHEDLDWQIIRLNKLVDLAEYDVQSEIEVLPPLRLPESFSQVFRLLWHTLNGVTPKKLPLAVKEENNQLNLTITSDFYSSLFVHYIDSETHKVCCNEPRGLSSICIANEFVKKVGGTLFMEADVKNGSVVTLILPVFQEDDYPN